MLRVGSTPFPLAKVAVYPIHLMFSHGYRQAEPILEGVIKTLPTTDWMEIIATSATRDVLHGPVVLKQPRFRCSVFNGRSQNYAGQLCAQVADQRVWCRAQDDDVTAVSWASPWQSAENEWALSAAGETKERKRSRSQKGVVEPSGTKTFCFSSSSETLIFFFIWTGVKSRFQTCCLKGFTVS